MGKDLKHKNGELSQEKEDGLMPIHDESPIGVTDLSGDVSAEIYERLGHTMDYMSDGFLSLNKKWEVLFVNKKGYELLEKSFVELVGKNIWKIFPDSTRSKAYLQYHEVMKTREQCEFESFFKIQQKWYEHRVVPTSDGISIFFQDITERKLASDKINEHSTLLEKSNKQLSDFCNIVSHNLRAPLVNISILVDFIESSKDHDEQLEMIGKIRPVINHLNDTFNELVETLQVRQNLDIKIEKLVFKEVIDKVLIHFQPRIDIYGLDLELNFDQAKSIRYSAKYLESIFTNFVSNAFKYRSSDKVLSITIKTEKSEHGVLLSFQDNGIGIDLKLHGNNMFKIGKVFHEHPNARGFGLFMTKNQIESLGGKIWVESAPNKGTTFFVELINCK